MALATHRRALELCSYCAKLCRHTCPVSNALGRETLIPQAKMHLLDLLRRNTVGWSADHAAPLFACTGCGLCQTHCRHGNDVASALWEGRAEANRRQLAGPAISAFPARDHARRERLAAHLREHMRPEWLDARATVAYLPGCDTIASSFADLEDAFTLFAALTRDRVRLIDERAICAGYPLWAAGARDEALFQANQLVRKLRPFDAVVLGCAACTYTMREILPAEGFDHTTKVWHLSEFLAARADELPLRRRYRPVYYHDPCYLGRRLGVYDPPRELLARCAEATREFFHARELAECCGGGGLVPLSYPEATREQARKRLREPELYRVSTVVTACSGCKRTLRSAKRPVKVLDLVNVLAWATRR